MKKVYFSIVFGYIIISMLVFIIIDNHDVKEVDMLLLEKDYARVLTENETIDIAFYLTKRDSFITDKTLISSAYLSSDIDEAAVDILEISDESETIVYQDQTYHKFFITLSLNSIFSQGLRLDFEGVELKLLYENDVEMAFYLGNIHVLFHSLSQPNHIDFDRLYSIHDGAMTGLYISLKNKTDELIEITSIETLVSGMTLDIGSSQRIYQTNDRILSINAYMPDYQPIRDSFSEGQSYYMNQDVDLLIPLQYIKALKYINRFPLLINYSYHDQMYMYVIDDFLFYDTISDFYKGHFHVNTYHYNYQ